MSFLCVQEVCKYYPAKAVLQNISLEFDRAHIYALLGENGAGKSTLAHIISGSLAPSAGHIYIEGKKQVFAHPCDAERSGIYIVHQRPCIALRLTMRENITLGSEPQKLFGLIDHARARAETEALISTQLPELTPVLLPLLDRPCGELTADARFFTALLATLWRKPSLLILDEPDASLDTAQRLALSRLLKQLSASGTAIILITHNLSEAIERSDFIDILDHGRAKIRLDAHRRQLSVTDIEQLLFNHEAAFQPASDTVRRAVCQQPEVLFSLHNVTARPERGAAIFGVSLSLHRGDICLIEGRRETGLQTLEDLVTGMSRAPCTGRISVGAGKGRIDYTLDRERFSSTALREAGGAAVPFDRSFRGANPRLPVSLTASVYRSGIRVKPFALTLAERAGIRIDTASPTAFLSGGMLQRLILERELEQKPAFIILCDPLQGLDAEHTAVLLKRLTGLAAVGTALLILAAGGQFPREVCSLVYRLNGGRISKLSLTSDGGAA